MDQTILVENRFENGQRLIAECVINSFDVSVAFWIKTAEDGLWFLYIGSKTLDSIKLADAYRQIYDLMARIPDLGIGISEVQIINANNPIAQDAIRARDKQPGRSVVRFQGNRLGHITVEEAYIYPRIGEMTPSEILHTLIALSNRPAIGVLRPSTITLQDGTRVSRVITGFNLQMPGGLTIQTLDPVTGIPQLVSGNDVKNIDVLA